MKQGQRCLALVESLLTLLPGRTGIRYDFNRSNFGVHVGSADMIQQEETPREATRRYCGRISLYRAELASSAVKT
jgi:hypothetical protein